MPRPAPKSRRAARGRSPRWPWVLVLMLLLAGGAWWRFGWPRTKPPVPSPATNLPPVQPVPALPATNPPPAIAPVIPPPPLAPPAPPTNAVVVVVRPPPATNVPPAPVLATPGDFVLRSATNMLDGQVALAQHGLSSGFVDGVGGAQTAAALRAFQFQQGLEETGRLDRDTQAVLKLDQPLLTRYTVTAEDLARPHPTPTTWLGKSEESRLDYQTLIELVAEQTHTHPNLLRRLNPGVNWDAVSAGTEVVVPNAAYPKPRRAARVRISLAGRYLRAFDGNGNLLAHFPVSIGRVAEKRPVGELTVAVSVKDPNYTFDPAVFPESEEGRELGRKLILPPGPNNPVGVAWIGLSRPGYGIHGTPAPEQVGRTESHGCFRLANWNAEYLRQMVAVGTPVWVEP